MNDKYERQMKKGVLDMLVLKLLESEAKYGYQETQEKATAYVQEQGYSFPVFFDSDSNGAYTYGIYSIPTTYLINSAGEIAAYAIGAISEEALEDALKTILTN